MKFIILVLFLSHFNSCSAFNCDSLSLIIKDKQLSIFPYYYEKTICDNYIRRDNAGLLKKLQLYINGKNTRSENVIIFSNTSSPSEHCFLTPLF